MTTQAFAKRLEYALADAREASELWVGTLIGEILEDKIKAMVAGVDSEHKEELLSDLLHNTQYAFDQYEDQERH